MLLCSRGILLSSLMLVVMSSSYLGAETASSCPEGWHLFGPRCFAFYPVRSLWSTAESVCSQRGGNLVSLNSLEEQSFVRQLVNTHTLTHVWLGGYHMTQGADWLWSDGSRFRLSFWSNQILKNTVEGGTCLAINSKELETTSCEELRFYVCSRKPREPFCERHFNLNMVSVQSACLSRTGPATPAPSTELAQGMTLSRVLWQSSESVAEQISNTPFMRGLVSGCVSAACSTTFHHQEQVYLRHLTSMLEVLIKGMDGSADIRELLLDTQKHYQEHLPEQNRSRTSVPSQAVLQALSSFHDVVLKDPIYWLVALWARAKLRPYLARAIPEPSPRSSHETGLQSYPGPRLYFKPAGPLERSNDDPETIPTNQQHWRQEALEEQGLADRLSEVLDRYGDGLDVYGAVDTFRTHMMDQKMQFRTACSGCEDEEE